MWINNEDVTSKILINFPGFSVALSLPCPTGFRQSGTSEGLGKVIFPNSCSSSAQGPFLKGIAQLHSFQYAAAESAFTEATHADSNCAIAYWGLAMSSYRPLWDGADQKALNKGRHFLDQIQKDWPVSQREQEYIDAIAIIFGDNHRLGDEHLAAYSGAMAEIAKHYPSDGEAQAFYALSVLALPHDDTKTREQVIAILNKLMAAQPMHPGAVHYLIHAADTAELAPQGLEAARRYAKIAPDSSHALHMPAHIFVRLGLWQESIDSNLAAAAAAAEATKNHMGEAQYQFHAMDFLDFSYLQLGEEAKARQVVEDLNKVTGASEGWIKNLRVILDQQKSAGAASLERSSYVCSSRRSFRVPVGLRVALHRRSSHRRLSYGGGEL